MRPLWKGAISFGLVNIPVGLYSALSRQATVDLDLLRDSDHSRIRYTYVLLRAALEKSGLAGVAKVVIRPPREHLALLRPLEGVLLLETMHFAAELRHPAELRPAKTDIGEKELKMAISLVETMTGKWEAEKYHDEYRESLMKIIEQKVKAGGRKIPSAPPEQKHPPDKVIDLVALLQESLGKTRKQPRKKTAARVAHRKAA